MLFTALQTILEPANLIASTMGVMNGTIVGAPSRGTVAASKDIPDDVYEKLSTSLKARYDGPRFQQFGTDNGLILDYVSGPDFTELKAEAQTVTDILKTQGP